MIARIYQINRVHVPCEFTIRALYTYITRCCFY